VFEVRRREGKGEARKRRGRDVGTVRVFRRTTKVRTGKKGYRGTSHPQEVKRDEAGSSERPMPLKTGRSVKLGKKEGLRNDFQLEKEWGVKRQRTQSKPRTFNLHEKTNGNKGKPLRQTTLWTKKKFWGQGSSGIAGACWERACGKRTRGGETRRSSGMGKSARKIKITRAS